MPFNAPQSLAPDEVYSVIAWLLLQNQVIAEDVVIDAQTLPKVQMPNRNGLKQDFLYIPIEAITELRDGTFVTI